MRSGVRFGMVLHTERTLALDSDPLAHIVVEVDVGHLGIGRQRAGVDGEVVVLAGDLDPLGEQVLHRVIPAVMTERQFHGLGTDRSTEQLVAQADAKDRQRSQQALD